MAKPLHFDKIEAYLTGQLTDEESLQFEKEAANDQQLANELSLQRLEHDAMERMLEQELKNKMASSWAASPPANPFLEKQEAKVVQLDARKNWRVLRIAAAIGGVLLITALLWRLTNNKPPEIVNEPPKKETPSEPPTQETPPITIPEETEIVETPDEPVNKKEQPKQKNRKTERPAPPPSQNNYLAMAENLYTAPSSQASSLKSGDAPSEKSAILQAAEALDEGRFKEALTLLGPPAADDQSTERYIRGHAYFKTGKYGAAAEEFKIIAADEFLPNYQEAQWYLLLSYLAQLPTTEKEFKALANQLANDEYSDYQQEAKDLLEKVQ